MEITAETYKEIFNTLNDIDLKGKVKEKMGLSYLSWAYAWGVLKQKYPTAKMNIYERKVDVKKTITHKYEDGTEEVEEISYTNEVPYFTDGMTAFVKVGVDINGIEYVEQLPVMNNKNQSVSLSLLKMTDVNKAIQRAFVKACARHGLGLYIYAGEDLPDASKKIIDYDAIALNCDRFATVILTQDGFESMRKTVIEGLQDNSYPEEAATAITSYGAKERNGKRISQLNYDIDGDKIAMQRISNCINEVRKALAAPDGK